MSDNTMNPRINASDRPDDAWGVSDWSRPVSGDQPAAAVAWQRDDYGTAWASRSACGSGSPTPTSTRSGPSTAVAAQCVTTFETRTNYAVYPVTYG